MTGSRHYREAPPAAAKPQDWRHGAVCRDEDPELFFPIGTGYIAFQQTELGAGWSKSDVYELRQANQITAGYLVSKRQARRGGGERAA